LFCCSRHSLLIQKKNKKLKKKNQGSWRRNWENKAAKGVKGKANQQTSIFKNFCFSTLLLFFSFFIFHFYCSSSFSFHPLAALPLKSSPFFTFFFALNAKLLTELIPFTELPALLLLLLIYGGKCAARRLV